MPGPNRRSRRLKQETLIGDINDFLSVNPQDGDMLIYNATNGRYENGRTIQGDLVLSGQVTTADLLVTEDATIQDALVVGGTTNLNSSLAVAGISTLNGDVTMAGTLGVTGAVQLDASLDLAGNFIAAGATFSGNVVMDQNLTVGGNLTADTLTVSALSLTSTETDNLFVTGNSDVQGQLTVGGSIGADNIVASTGMSSPLMTAGALTVTASATIQDPTLVGTITATIPLDFLSDVNVGTPGAPEDGQVVTWDNGTSEYILAPLWTPSAAYTPTNVTTDRTYDADTVAVDELADVVGTLIADLQAIGLLT